MSLQTLNSCEKQIVNFLIKFGDELGLNYKLITILVNIYAVMLTKMIIK